MPKLPKQNESEDTGKYRADKLPVILSEVQGANAYQRQTFSYNDYQRARRTDAEPITRR